MKALLTYPSFHLKTSYSVNKFTNLLNYETFKNGLDELINIKKEIAQKQKIIDQYFYEYLSMEI